MRELRERTLEELDYRAEAERQRVFAAEYGCGSTCTSRGWSPPRRRSWSRSGSTASRCRGWSTGPPGPHRPRPARAHDRRGDVLLTRAAGNGARRPAPRQLHAAGRRPAGDDRLRRGRGDAGGIPRVLARTLRHIADGEPVQTTALMRSEGFIHGDIGPDDVIAYIGALADPLRSPRFRFDRAWTPGRVRASRTCGGGLPGDRPGPDPAGGVPPVPGVLTADERAGRARLHGRGPRHRRAVGAGVRRRVSTQPHG